MGGLFMLNHFYLSIALFFSLFIMLYVTVISWKRRKYPTAYKIFFLMLTSSIYTFGYAYEILLPDLRLIKTFLNIEYLGIPFIPAICFMLITDLLGMKKLKKWYGLTFIIPVITFILQHSNDYHHLFYKDLFIPKYQEPLVHLVKGPWYWVHISYSYFIILLCLLYLFLRLREKKVKNKKRIILMMLGISVPFVSNIIYLLLSRQSALDLTPYGLSLSGIIFSWLNYRYNLLQFNPIAFEEVFKTMEEGVIVIDYYNHIVNFNPAAVVIIPELEDVLPIPMDNNSISIFSNYPCMEEALKQNRNKETEFWIERDKGNRIYKMNLSFLEEKRKVIGKIIVLKDITAVKNNQNSITAATAQLNALKIINNRILKIIENDIEKPLDKLAFESISMDERMGKDSELKEGMGDLRRTADELVIKVSHIKECFKIKNTEITFSPKDWKLSCIAKEAVDTVKDKAVGKEILIHSDIPEDIYVHSDKNLLKAVIVNLLSNSIKFTYRNGKIELSAFRENQFVIISVKDTGVGIDSEKIQILFQDVESEPGIGTEGEIGVGLGLFMSRHLIQRIHGDIWVDSNVGEGSNFFISIPIL